MQKEDPPAYMAIVRKLDAVLRSEPHLAQALQGAEELAALQRSYLKKVPPSLAALTKVAAVNTRELKLSANNGAVATRLRQLAPHLLAAFQREGRQFTSIRVIVQVQNRASIDGKRVAKQIDKIGRQALEAFAQTLPHDDLRLAIEHLLETVNDKRYG